MNQDEKDLIEQIAEQYGFQQEAVEELMYGRGDNEDEQQPVG